MLAATPITRTNTCNGMWPPRAVNTRLECSLRHGYLSITLTVFSSGLYWNLVTRSNF